MRTRDDYSSVIVLISGRGSNLQSIIENAKNYSVIRVFTDNPSAPGLEIALKYGIPSKAFSNNDFKTKKSIRKAIFEAISNLNPNLIALAGFMQIIDKEWVETFYGRMLNIHPSLLPNYPGLNTHERALKDYLTDLKPNKKLESIKARKHGCSVHYVTANLDVGPIIAQASCPIHEKDTASILAARVLEREHALYPWVLNHLSRGNIQFLNNKIMYNELVKAEAKQLDFILPQ